MATTLKQFTVYGGSNEYYAEMPDPVAGDKLLLQFDSGEFVIDDLFITTAGTTVDYMISISYPVSGATGRVMTIVNTTDAEFVLNPFNTSARANLWYRLPAGSNIVVQINSGASFSEALQISVIGRPA